MKQNSELFGVVINLSCTANGCDVAIGCFLNAEIRFFPTSASDRTASHTTLNGSYLHFCNVLIETVFALTRPHLKFHDWIYYDNAERADFWNLRIAGWNHCIRRVSLDSKTTRFARQYMDQGLPIKSLQRSSAKLAHSLYGRPTLARPCWFRLSHVWNSPSDAIHVLGASIYVSLVVRESRRAHSNLFAMKNIKL